MNRIEDRLCDAFAAAAGTVRPESVRGLSDRLVVTRTRHLAPLAAAAAVAVVVIGAAVITSLALAGGHHSRASSTGAGAAGPAASASPSGALLVVPDVTGMSASQASATLQKVGLRISQWPGLATTGSPSTVLTQDPAPGTQVPVSAIVTLTINSSVPNETFTLAPSRLATVSAYAVTVRIPRSWRPTRGIGPAVGYNGTSGWVQVQAVTEPAGLQAACRSVAAHDVSQYGRVAYISYRSIDGRPGCQIVPETEYLLHGQLAMISSLVGYRSPLRDGANFLLINADPAFSAGIVDSVRLHR